MSRKLLNEVDGFVVDTHAGTFTGSFEVRGADAKYLAYDDEVLIVVRARVKPPRLKEAKNGDITRVNVLQIKEAGVVRSDELKSHLCETMGLDVPDPQLSFDSVEVEVPMLESGLNQAYEPEIVTDVEVVQSSAPPDGLMVEKFPSDPKKGDHLARYLAEQV